MSINVTVHGNPISINRGKMVTLDSDKEFALRRKIRLQQVRDQSKEIAEEVRKKVQREKNKHLCKAAKAAEKCMIKKKEEMLSCLNEQYQRCLEEFGEAYKRADSEVDPEDIIVQIKKHNECRAGIRGKEAVNCVRREKDRNDERRNNLLECKKKCRETENIRSKLVSNISKNKKSPFKKKKRRKKLDLCVTLNGDELLHSSQNSSSCDDILDKLSVIEEISRECEADKNSTSSSNSDFSDHNSSNSNGTYDDNCSNSNGSIVYCINGNCSNGNCSNGNCSKGYCDDGKCSNRNCNDGDASHANCRSRPNPGHYTCKIDGKTKNGKSVEFLSPSTKNQMYKNDTHSQSSFKSHITHKYGDDTSVIKKNEKEPVKRQIKSSLYHTEYNIADSLPISPKYQSSKSSSLKNTEDKKSILKSTVCSSGMPKKEGEFKKMYDKPFKAESPRKTITTSKLSTTKRFDKVPDFPYVPKLTITSETPKLHDFPTNYYDRFNLFNNEQSQRTTVQKITKDSIEVLPSDNEEPMYNEIQKQQSVEAKMRGNKAFKKISISQDYEQLMQELPLLKHQEQLAILNRNKQNFHMSEERIHHHEREKQNRMENAYEKTQIYTQHISPIITLKPMKKLPPSNDIKEPYKTLDVTEGSTLFFNVGQWENINKRNKASENDSTEDSLQSTELPRSIDNEKAITDLLKRVNKQRDLLLKEAANLPSLVNLKEALDEKELLELICKSPTQSAQTKVLREMGTSPVSLKPVPTVFSNNKKSGISKITSKRLATTSSGDTSTEITQTKPEKKKPKTLIKQQKILIREEATQTSPLVSKSPNKANKKREESTQTSVIDVDNHINKKNGFSKKALNSDLNNLSSNSDKVCEIIIRAPEDKNVQITHHSVGGGGATDKVKTKQIKHTDKLKYKKTNTSNVVIKIKESQLKNDAKFKSSEVSAGTSYQSLPTEVSSGIKNLRATEYYSSNRELLEPQKRQTNLNQLVNIEDDGRKEVNPRLLKYIIKLLSMSRQSIDELIVSSVSDVSTPHESVVQSAANQAKEKLQSVLQHFNLTPEEIKKCYISSSTLSTTDVSLENEIREILKPTIIFSSDDKSYEQDIDPAVVNMIPKNGTYSSSVTETAHYSLPPRPRSPAAHAIRKTRQAKINDPALTPRVHSPVPLTSYQVFAHSNQQIITSSSNADSLPTRPSSPSAHAKREVQQDPRNDNVVSHSPESHILKEVRPNAPRLLSGYTGDGYKAQLESHKQFTSTDEIDRYSIFGPERTAVENIFTDLISQEQSSPVQRRSPKSVNCVQEIKSFSLELQKSPTVRDSNQGNSSQSPKDNQSNDIKYQNPEKYIGQQTDIVDNLQSQEQFLQFVKDNLGMSEVEFNNFGFRDIFSRHTELSEFCHERIQNLMDLIEKVKNDKITLCTPTPDDPSITITSYMELPGKKTTEQDSSTSSSTISQEALDKYLLGFEKNPVPPQKVKKHKERTEEKSENIRDSKNFFSDNSETFVPMLQGIPKYGEGASSAPFVSQIIQEMKSKPPPSLLRANVRGYVDVVPHELSTIVEADTIISSRNATMNCNMKSPKSPKRQFQKSPPISPKKMETSTNQQRGVEFDHSSNSGDYITITPGRSIQLQSSNAQDRSFHSSKSPMSQKSPKQQKQSDALKGCTKNTTTTDQDLAKLSRKSNLSGVQPLSDSTNTSPDELESLLRKFKLEWAISLVRKTEQALALSSSSSTSEIDSRIKSDMSIVELYRQLYKKLASSSGSDIEKSQILSDLSSHFKELNEISRIHSIGEQKPDSQTDSRNRSQQHRTSTPVHISKSSDSYSKENLFKADSEISSVRNTSEENLFLSVPSLTLNTTNCSLNKSKK